MELKLAIQEINDLRVATTDKRIASLLDKWNELILEISSFQLTEIEHEAITSELNVHLQKFKKNNLTRALIKSSLRSFLKQSKKILKAKDEFVNTLIGICCGILLAVLTVIPFLLGALIGAIVGRIIDTIINKKQRYISVNLHDTW